MKKTDAAILIVDDDSHVLFTIQTLLERYVKHIFTEIHPARIPSLLMEKNIDVILLDMNFSPGETSGKEGMEWIGKIRELDNQISIVPMTAYGDIKVAVEALKLGAVDFVIKPWQNEKLLATVNAAVNYTKSRRQVQKISRQREILEVTDAARYSELIGNSEVIREVKEKIKKVAPTDANVLILGENGTGKELVAHSIHRLSNQRNESFIHVDLGAIPESLFEPELFGHVKGAFTDAKEDRTGRFEVADQGTLFLDEIGNLPLHMQTKLLSVLQNKQLYKVGSHKPVNIDVRLISATNEKLHKLTETQKFRMDLFYRINTVEITLPPLRERKDDIELLAVHFQKKYSSTYKKPMKSLPENVMKRLLSYDWPGNVRELQHAMERAVILCESDQLSVNEFEFRGNKQEGAVPFDHFNLEKWEKWLIENGLKKHRGNITKTAKELGLTRGALYRRLEKYDLS